MTEVVVAGADESDFGSVLERPGATVRRVSGPLTTSALREAGIESADVFVLTDVDEATGIPIARELTDSIRIVVVDTASVPEFAAHQADLLLAPGELDAELVVEALLDDEV